MSKIKRPISLLLTFVMVLTMVSVGLTFTANAAAPYVTRTAASNPAPSTFTVPDAVTTYGTNENLSGNNVRAEGSVQFYLPGATDIVISTNSSGVNVGTPTVVGNVTVWNISGGVLAVPSATNVKFTVSYKINNKNYTSSAWSAVYSMHHDAVVKMAVRYKATFYQMRPRVVLWLSPTFGSFTGTGGSSIFYIPETDTVVETTDASKSGVSWSHDYGNTGGDKSEHMTGDIANPPVGTYCADLSLYTTMAQLPLKLYTREYEADIDGNHDNSIINILIYAQTLNGGSVSTFGLSGVTGSQSIAYDTTYTTGFTGNLPSAGSVIDMTLRHGVRVAVPVSQNFDAYAYIKLQVNVCNKGTLKQLVSDEKAANRQQANYSTTGTVTWSTYASALQTAYEVLGRQNTTQTAVDAAVNALSAAIPYYLDNGTSNGEWVSGMKYADASYESADYQISTIPSNFTGVTYTDGTKGKYYTWTTASAVNQALEDIAYDRALNKRYQAVVDTMTVNLQTAIGALQYKSCNLVFNSNGGENAPATTTKLLYDIITAPTTSPTRQYYTFNGWYFDANCTLPASWPLAMNPGLSYFSGDLSYKDDTIRTGVTLYAGWTRTATRITFVSNGDTTVDPIYGTPGAACTGPATTPTKGGYNFVGWCTDVTLTNLVNFSTYTFPSSDTTLYGKWALAKFTITFDSNGGTFASNNSATLQITDDYNKTVNEPEIPTKYGKGFVGWYSDNNTFVNKITFPITIPNANITYYAKWSDTTYTITYESNGGTSVPYAFYVTGETVTSPTPAPTRSGYTFDKWCSDINLTVAVSFPFLMTAGSKIFYAKWIPQKFNVDFDLGDDAYAPLQAEFPASFNQDDYHNRDCGSTLTEPENPTMEGYVFTGWTYNGVAYTFTTVPPQNITLVATWEEEPPTCTYRLRTDKTGILQQGDVVTVTMSVQTNYIVGSFSFIVYYDKRYFEPALKGNTYTTGINSTAAVNTNGNTYFTLIDNPENVKVEDWNVWENGQCSGRVNFCANQPPLFYPASWRSGSTLLTEYANYDYVNFQCANNIGSASEGYCVTPNPEQDICRFQLKVKDTAPVTVTGDYAKIFIPEYYTREVDANSKNYASLEDGNEYDVDYQATGITYVFSNKDINYSIIQMQTSTVTFDSKGGSAINAITDKEGRAITLPTPTRAYNTFLGWSLVDGSTNYVGSSYVVPTNDVTLYAQWQAQSAAYKVRHWKQNVSGDGYLATYEEETFSDVIGTVVTATPKTYAGFNTPNSVSDTVVANGSLVMNLYYTRKTINVTLNPGGGVLSGSSTLSGLFGATVTAPSNPSRTGYTFANWTYNNATYNFTTFPSASIELVAAWTANNYTFRFYVNNELKDTKTIAYGSTLNAYSVTLDTGMVFSGWSCNGTSYTFPMSAPAANMDFYGTTSINGYYVTCYIDGVQYGTPISVYNGTPLTAAQVAYTPANGYNFSGWKLSNSTNGVPVTFPLTPVSNMSIYGFTSRAKYDIAFWIYEMGYYDGQENVTFGTALASYILEAPEMDGYWFDGWYTDEAMTQPLTATTMPAYDLNLYGRYVELTGTIAFNLNGGSGTTPNSIVAPIGTIVSGFPTDNDGADFYKNEYVFIGWGSTPDATEAITELIIESEETVTLYAIWVPDAVELVVREGSSTVINATNNYIYGLPTNVSESQLREIYLRVDGNGHIVIHTNNGVIGTGSTIDLVNDNTGLTVATYTIIIFGDLNGDGQILQTDLTMLKGVIAGSTTLVSGTPLFYAVDLNHDDMILQSDYTSLKSVISSAYVIDQTTGIPHLAI